jgi:hypothetical protein
MADSCSREQPRVNSGDKGFVQYRKGNAMDSKHARERHEILPRFKKTLI